MEHRMSAFEVRRLSGALGAEVLGLDLSKPLGDASWKALHEAFLNYHVLAIRDQKLGREEQLAFARRFGMPEVHAIVEGTPEHPDVIRVHKPAGASASFGVGWHSDNSFQEAPTGTTVLYGEVIPPFGGDTLFANMTLAHAALSPAMQARLEGLRAIHSASRAYDPALVGREKYDGTGPLKYTYSEAVHEEHSHPLVRTDPRTGRKVLFVNPMFTLRIEDLNRAESEALLRFLFEHGASPDFQGRVRWQPGTVTVWDNRIVWHYALDDYQEYERLMYRVTLTGERPA